MNAFEVTLREIRRGACQVDLSQALVEATAAVKENRKKATITLKLTLAPGARGDASVVAIEDDIKVILPKPEKTATLMYINDQNQLVKNDPNQKELPLKVVEKQEPALKQVVNG